VSWASPNYCSSDCLFTEVRLETQSVCNECPSGFYLTAQYLCVSSCQKTRFEAIQLCVDDGCQNLIRYSNKFNAPFNNAGVCVANCPTTEYVVVSQQVHCVNCTNSAGQQVNFSNSYVSNISGLSHCSASCEAPNAMQIFKPDSRIVCSPACPPDLFVSADECLPACQTLLYKRLNSAKLCQEEADCDIKQRRSSQFECVPKCENLARFVLFASKTCNESCAAESFRVDD
jgi:hypothetical protein